MPYIESADGWEYYNVTFAIGDGGVIAGDDVMLVQYFLMAIYRSDPCLPFKPGPLEEMKVDGICGPITLKWIHAYQEDCGLWADSRVDRAPPGTHTSQSGTEYAISSMNGRMMRLMPWIYPEPGYSDITPPSDAPARLQAVMVNCWKNR
jgi:hypothetical protein